MGKPGTMLYWETFDVLDRAKPEKVKTLLRAIRNYSQYGESPDFAGDEALELVWPALEQRLSVDNERYRQRSEQATNAANARWGHASACKSMSAHADACEPMPGMPTTTPTPTTPTSATDNVYKGDKGKNGCADNQPIQPQEPPPATPDQYRAAQQRVYRAMIANGMSPDEAARQTGWRGEESEVRAGAV